MSREDSDKETEMTRREAEKILGVQPGEDAIRIKARFRKLITRYHPDSKGGESKEALRMTQQINQAYTILCKQNDDGMGNQATRKQTKRQPEKKAPVWKAKVLDWAFTKRTIYHRSMLWEESNRYYEEVIQGRYAWDPELEEFDCLLRSLHQATRELLEQAEERCVCDRDEEQWATMRRPYQIQLFHLLASQFIQPVECLEKLQQPEQTDAEGRKIYHFKGHLGTFGRMDAHKIERLQEQEMLYPVAWSENRIQVADREGVSLGHLSLAEDACYYIIIPILQQKAAQVKILVDKVEKKRYGRTNKITVQVSLYLRMEKEPDIQKGDGYNLQIASLLKDYEDYIR